VLSMCLACWTVHVAAVHAHLRVVGMHSGFCCLAAWCIGTVCSPILYLNSSNLNLPLVPLFVCNNLYIYIFLRIYF